MYLLVDNSLPDTVVFQYVDDAAKTERILSRSPGGLLVSIQAFLAELHLEISDLSGLAVVVGKGRFTATRVAVTIANTLAFAQEIPVLAVKEFTDPHWLQALQEAIPGRFIAAEYSAEPRVGGK